MTPRIPAARRLAVPLRITASRRRLLIGGFTMVEALVAFAIGGFGLMAVARLHANLVGVSDQAKQLGEATMIGERKIEELRSFQQLTAATGAQLAAGQWGYSNVASGTQSVTGTNTTYALAWNVADAAGGAAYKTVAVTVGWTDRQNNARNVNLSGIVAGSNPTTSLGMVVPPAGTPVRKPKNRDLNVPVPATDLGNGTSAFTPPGAATSVHIVFNNLSGIVTQVCTGAGAAYVSWTCSNVTAYLVSGFVAVDNQAHASINSPMTFSISVTLGTFDMCYSDSGAGTKTYPGFATYTCLVYPDATTSPARWSGIGSMAITGITLGVSASDDRICRYTGDYDASGAIDNAEHPAAYAGVNESLENQNFIVMKGSAACPPGAVQHQP